MLSIMGERERTQEYEIRCHVCTFIDNRDYIVCIIYGTFAKFQENTTILSYIHVQYTLDTMNIQYQKNTLLSRHNWI